MFSRLKLKFKKKKVKLI